MKRMRKVGGRVGSWDRGPERRGPQSHRPTSLLAIVVGLWAVSAAAGLDILAPEQDGAGSLGIAGHRIGAVNAVTGGYHVLTLDGTNVPTEARVVAATSGITIAESDPIYATGMPAWVAAWAATATVANAQQIKSADGVSWVVVSNGQTVVYWVTNSTAVRIVSTNLSTPEEGPGEYTGPPTGTEWHDAVWNEVDRKYYYTESDGWTMTHTPGVCFDFWKGEAEFKTTDGDQLIDALPTFTWGYGTGARGWNTLAYIPVTNCYVLATQAGMVISIAAHNADADAHPSARTNTVLAVPSGAWGYGAAGHAPTAASQTVPVWWATGSAASASAWLTWTTGQTNQQSQYVYAQAVPPARGVDRLTVRWWASNTADRVVLHAHAPGMSGEWAYTCTTASAGTVIETNLAVSGGPFAAGASYLAWEAAVYVTAPAAGAYGYTAAPQIQWRGL